jgi:quinone-modifying oxidoreductase subunit QmoA
MASLKQTQYVREAFGDEGKSTIYYIDIRAIDRFEDFYQMVQKDATSASSRARSPSIVENKENGNPILHGVDTEGYHRYATEHDLVVLAVGMEPRSRACNPRRRDPRFLELHRWQQGQRGMFGAGAPPARSTSIARCRAPPRPPLRAIQVIKNRPRGGLRKMAET